MARYTFKDFQEQQGLEATGAVVGDVTALATSNSKYKGAQRGKAIGGGIGTAAGAAIGMPMVGQAVGSLIGGLIGGASDKKKMIEDYDEVASERYSRLNLMPNINPYGNAASYADGGFIGDPVDPTKPKPKPAVRTLIPGQTTVLNEKQQLDVNNWTKDFEARHGGNPYFVTNAVQVRKVGDPLAPFVGDIPPEPVKKQTVLPRGITPDMVELTNEGYGYWHPQEGTFIPVDMQAIAPAKNTKSLPKNAVFLGDPVVKMKKGGVVKKGYHKMPNGKMMKNSAMMEGGGMAGMDPSALATGAIGMLGQVLQGEDTGAIVDDMMGMLPPMRKGGVVNDPPIRNPKYKFSLRDHEPTAGDSSEYRRMYNMAVNNPKEFKSVYVDPAWGAYASATSTRGADVQKARLQAASFRQSVFDDAQEARSEAQYNQFSATPVSKNPITKYAEGGMAPEREMINIEKGEILIDPVTLDVIRKYENPNRYKAHQKDPMKEPVGNFTMIEKGKVIIPKKYAERYEKGDILTRKSIVGEILKNQYNNPQQNDPRMTTDARFAQAGMVAGGELEHLLGSDPFGTQGIIADVPGVPAGPRYPVARIDDPAVDGLPQFPASAVNGAPYNWQPPISGQAAAPAGEQPAANAVVKNKLNTNMIASKIASFLPTAYGITNALGVDPYLRYDENTQMDTAKAYAASMETDPNIDASLAAIRRRSSQNNRVLNNFNSPSTRAEVAANQAQLLNAEGEIIQRGQDISQNARNRKRETLMNLEAAQGNQRLDMRKQLMNELRMDKANRENMVHAGISEGVTNFQKGVMDQERIKAINTAAQFYQVDPYSASLLVDQHAFMPYVTDMMGKLSGTIPGVGRMEPTTEVSKVNRDRLGNPKSSTQIVVKKPKKN